MRLISQRRRGLLCVVVLAMACSLLSSPAFGQRGRRPGKNPIEKSAWNLTPWVATGVAVLFAGGLFIRSRTRKNADGTPSNVGPKHWTILGALVGAAVGYPLSYYFQHPIVRAKVPFWEYYKYFADVVGEDDIRGAVIGTSIVCVIVGTAVGFAIGISRRPKSVKVEPAAATTTEGKGQ